MIKIKLTGHDFQYELFQIISLFYDKDEIEFTKDYEFDFESYIDLNNYSAGFKIYNNNVKIIEEKLKLVTEDKKNIKNSIKITALRALKQYTGIDIPWGILVGIRPTKIVHEYLKQNLNDSEILNLLLSNYDISFEKAMLALETAKNESKFLEYNYKKISLYLDVPFCPTRCIYCSFTSTPVCSNESLVQSYIDTVIKEINETLSFINKNNLYIDTIYIGGGTPTSLNANQLEAVLGALNNYIDLQNVREFTVEAGRPDSLDEIKLSILKKYFCTRISINPQTMNDSTLKTIGRMHTSKDVVEKYYLSRNIGFDNINMDIIIGLPGEDEDNIRHTMQEIKKLSPDSITIHTMAVKRASYLNEIGFKSRNKKAEDMYNIALKAVRDMGMYPYYMYRQKNMVSPLENVGFCKMGKECIYNIQMIAENISIAGLGPGAITKLVFLDENRIERIANVKDIREYIIRIDEMIEKKIKGLKLLFQI